MNGPKLAPNLVKMPAPENRWTSRFSHRGRDYSLFKRVDSEAAPYYVRVQRLKTRYKHCLETNQQKVAITRAKTYIDSIIEEKWEVIEKLKSRRAISRLDQVLSIYQKSHGIGQRAAKNNVLSLLKILERVRGQKVSPAEVSLSDITSGLAVKFQDRMIELYTAQADRNDGAQREARERALRTSRSMIQQARSIFVSKPEHDLLKKYDDAGLFIPENVQGFMTVKLRGKIVKDDYFAPSDDVVEKAFIEIEKVRDRDRNVYKLFWLAVGAGLRKGEAGRAEWPHLVIRDGRTWVSGGIGKDGRRIEVPMQSRAAKALEPFRDPVGPIIDGESVDSVAKRLNWWMKFNGWDTEKKLHELRAYIGSLIYRESPIAAMTFMRHKSIRTTELFYRRYGLDAKPVDVL